MMNKIDETSAIPKLRSDISVNVIKENGQEFVLMNDLEQIAPNPLAVTLQMYKILFTLDGIITWDELRKVFKTQLNGNDEILAIIFQNIETLYENNFLETPEYLNRKKEIDQEYLSLEERPPVCSGNTYPAEKNELEKYLNEFFNSVNKNDIKKGAENIIVPHIDFQIGDVVHKTYAAGYHSLRDTDAELFVIFGTSHYASSDNFMLSEKHYSTPLGRIETDLELLDLLKSKYPKLKIDEFAHKNEHSIELQAVLIQHYFKNKNIKILPVLVGSFHEYMMNGSTPEEHIKEFMDALKESLSEHNKKAVIISSVDFAHIGRKFGDNFDADEKLDELVKIDRNLIDSLVQNQHEQFFDKIKIDNDRWKVCGTAPMYSMLQLQNSLKGELLQYGQWYEQPTKSAVSFASIAYYNTNIKE